MIREENGIKNIEYVDEDDLLMYKARFFRKLAEQRDEMDRRERKKAAKILSLEDAKLRGGDVVFSTEAPSLSGMTGLSQEMYLPGMERGFQGHPNMLPSRRAKKTKNSPSSNNGARKSRAKTSKFSAGEKSTANARLSTPTAEVLTSTPPAIAKLGIVTRIGDVTGYYDRLRARLREE
jgi:hypothetical protein